MNPAVERLIAWTYKLRLSSRPSVHPELGAFDKAALRAMAELFARRIRFYGGGALIGAVQAKKAGYDRVRMIEFGVASGLGLKELIAAADIVARHLDIAIDIVGLDNDTGLPPASDYRDHPEIWRAGQFAMGGAESLRAQLPANCSLLIGDIRETLQRLETGIPIAFMAIDVDYYSSTVPILDWFKTAPVENLLPATPIYFDDVSINWTYGPSAGEELAIAEFNADPATRLRRIDLKSRRHQLYALQALDHPIRTGAQPYREPFEIYYRRYIPSLESVLLGPPE
jgi:hypothetical protein